MHKLKKILAMGLYTIVFLSAELFAQGSMGKWPHKGGPASPVMKIIVIAVLVIAIAGLVIAAIKQRGSSKK